MMEWVQQLLNGSTIPLVTAFLLGLLTAVSPCPLAANITAIGYISKDVENRHRVFRKGLLYALGRVVAYTSIGLVLIPILREGASIYPIQRGISQYGELLLAPILIFVGLFMLFGHWLNLPQWGVSWGVERMNKRGGWGAFLLGVLFSFAFCPSSGVLYFGMLIPMSAAEAGGYFLPMVYAVATGLPVVLVAWILAYSVSGIGRFYSKIQIVQCWMNRIIALLFIAIGIYYAIELWLE